MGCCGSCGGQDTDESKEQDKEQNKDQEQNKAAEANKDNGQQQK